MNRQMYQWISQLVRDKPDQDSKRPLSSLGRQVQARYGCGYASNNRLIFNAEDKRRLRQRVKDELGLDPFTTEQLPADRLEMAQYHANEKLASKAAGEDQLLLNSADGILRINNVEIQLHPEGVTLAGLLCLNSSIKTIEHKTIVVIENLAIMQLCHTWQLPLPDPQALWVYRGDYKSGAKAQACRDFVERFGANKTVIVFSDMDPKGLEIAVTMPHVDYWLGPKESAWHACLQSRHANCDGFDFQSQALAYLQRVSDSHKLPCALTKLLVCLKNERSSYRQEHMYSHHIPLELFNVGLQPE